MRLQRNELMPDALVVHFVADAATETSVLELCRTLNSGGQERAWRHAVVRIDDAGDTGTDVHAVAQSDPEGKVDRQYDGKSDRKSDLKPGGKQTLERDAMNETIRSSGLTVHHIRSAAGSGGRISWCSFELRALLVGCSLLHIHNPFTAAGEAAFALGKNLKLRCVLDCSATPSSLTGWKWGMAELADVITCNSDRRASELRRDSKKPVCVLGNGVPDIGTRLSAIYGDLIR
jgi:hypothetical protein